MNQEVEKGTIVRMPEKEARERYGGRLAVAALGAVPKELGTKKVRLIHDDGIPTVLMSIDASEFSTG